ncbi:MAG TPA: hypothetical protein VMF30_06800 [Pirellulales bacterium]|nr:hypothetical protein [Pirellulales bacterium]
MNVLGRLGLIVLLAGWVAMPGCGPAAPATPKAEGTAGEKEHAGLGGHIHDDDADEEHEHEHHESFADAVTELDGLRDAARRAMGENNVKAADDAVHEIGHILEELPSLAAKEAATAEDTEVRPAIDELFECFDQIDHKLHGEAGKTYDEVSQRVDAAMETLRAKLKPTNP